MTLIIHPSTLRIVFVYQQRNERITLDACRYQTDKYSWAKKRWTTCLHWTVLWFDEVNIEQTDGSCSSDILK